LTKYQPLRYNITKRSLLFAPERPYHFLCNEREMRTYFERNDIMETLGNRIARLRKRKDITQDQLAEYMGISAQTVSKWENDITCPDISALPRLADYFNVTVDELLRGDEPDKVKLVPKNERGDPTKAILRVKVLSAKGDKVNVNLPMIFLKTAIESGVNLDTVTGEKWMQNIDIGRIIEAAENGVIGKFVEVESADGDFVEVWIEQ